MLPIEYTSKIYYIIREARTSIYKRAKASSIKVCMFSFEEHLHISIGDDGVGMPKYCVKTHMESGYQQGLVGLHERAALLEGVVTIESVAGKGTRLDVDIPLPYQHP